MLALGDLVNRVVPVDVGGAAEVEVGEENVDAGNRIAGHGVSDGTCYRALGEHHGRQTKHQA